MAGPAVAAGALITTVAVTAWPSSADSLQAVPRDLLRVRPPSAPAPGTAESARAAQADRGARSETRPSLTALDEKAAMVEAAQEQAEAEAAKEKAAKEQGRPAGRPPRRRPPSSTST